MSCASICKSISIRENITPRGDGNININVYLYFPTVHKREYNSERRRKRMAYEIVKKEREKIRENITPRGDGNQLLAGLLFIYLIF